MTSDDPAKNSATSTTATHSNSNHFVGTRASNHAVRQTITIKYNRSIVAGLISESAAAHKPETNIQPAHKRNHGSRLGTLLARSLGAPPILHTSPRLPMASTPVSRTSIALMAKSPAM